jgi:hypothetical protein
LIHLRAVMRVNSSWLPALSTRMVASATQSTVGVAWRCGGTQKHAQRGTHQQQ